MNKYRIQPISIRDANSFVDQHHRTRWGVKGAKFAISLVDVDSRGVGVVIVGRPVSRVLDNGVTAEVTRMALLEGIKNGASQLLGAARRTCKGMGYQTLQTYISEDESGVSLKASGWTLEAVAVGSRRRPGLPSKRHRVQWLRQRYPGQLPSEYASAYVVLFGTESGSIKGDVEERLEKEGVPLEPAKQLWKVAC